MSHPRTGVWIVGVHGDLATTLITGVLSIRRGSTPPLGVLTERPEFGAMDLTPLQDLVFGGHDVRECDHYETARDIHRHTGSLPIECIEEVRDELREVSGRCRAGSTLGCGAAIEALQTWSPHGSLCAGEVVDRLVGDLQEFRDEHQLERLVVVNLASTEPPAPWTEPYLDRAALEGALSGNGASLRAGLLYAWSAFRAGAAYVNFTPSSSALCPATEDLAREAGLPYMGNDGKTGETLVKSALAPMFKYRNLKVTSWIGYNILGNRDGQILAQGENKQSKLASKDSVLPSILGYPLKTHVGIDYVESLGDHKVAWDFIHFEGFLGHRMSMQFTWQGCDSILAAPLVLDLTRLADHALRHGESGPMLHLASFFKSPIHSAEHDLHRQFHRLTDYLAAWSAAP